MGAGRGDFVQPFHAAWRLDAFDFEQCLVAGFWRAGCAASWPAQIHVSVYGLRHVWRAGANPIPIIGASGGVAGLMGAAARFAFSDVRWLDPNAQEPRRRLLRLSEVPRRRPVVIFIAVWLIMNLSFGLLGPYGLADPSGTAVNVAWVAHLGGFFAGLLLIGLLEKPPLSASGGPGHVDYGDWKNRK